MADGIDSAALGEAIAKHLAPVVERMERTVAAVATRPQEPEKDTFKEALDDLLTPSEDGKIDISKVSRLLDEHGKKLSKDTRVELQRTVLGERANRAKREIDLELDKYGENDGLITAVAPQLKLDIIKEFDTSKEFEDERQAMLERDVSASAIRRLVKKHVERMEKAAERKEGGKESGGTVTKTSTSTGNNKLDAATADRSKLTPAQQNLFDSHKGHMIRGGYKPEEAEAAAMTAALRRKA